MELADEHPRVLLFEDILESDILHRGFARSGRFRLLPTYLAAVLEAYARRLRYDAVLTWGERLSLLYALLLRLTLSNTPHIALMGWVSPPKKALVLRVVQSRIDQIITWSSLQRDIAIEHLQIPASKIALVPHPVDERFWRPVSCEADMICAVGNQMRDYPTLIEAMRGLRIRCHIAARPRWQRRTRKVTTVEDLVGNEMPPNVTVGAMTAVELRALYARSRFVVIPLRPADSDNGITTILEAMAMGKAVICSRAAGQVDAVREGTTGIYVAPGDANALRDAIQYLWDNPAVAERMGAEGRRAVEATHTLDQFVDRVKRIVEEVIEQRRLLPTDGVAEVSGGPLLWRRRSRL